MVTDYMKFQAKLYPVLPFLIFQAAKVRKIRSIPSSISEHLVLGKGDRKILIIGESTVAGVGASAIEFTLAGHIFKQLGKDFQVFNYGKNGIRASQTLLKLGDSLNTVPGKVEGVFLFLGANDCFRLTHPRRFKVELEVIIQHLKWNFAPDWIYLADIPPVQLFPAFPKLLQYYLNAQRSFLLKEMSAISSVQKGVLFDKIRIDISSDFFASDMIHPSDAGYQKIAEFAIDGLLKNGLLQLD
jgi:lysophospholipase L1-like esterase